MSFNTLLPVSSPSTFEEALQRFKAKLSSEQIQEFNCTTQQDVEVLAIKLQKDQEQRRSHAALGLLRPFIDGLSQYAKVIEVFAQTSEILAFVWGPIKFLLQIGSQWQKAIDKIMDALAGIGDKLVLFEISASLVIAEPRFKGVLIQVYVDILDFIWVSLRIFGQKTREQFFRIHSPVFEKRLSDVLDKLDENVNNLHKAVSITHLNESLNFHNEATEQFKKIAHHRNFSILNIFRQELQPSFLSTYHLKSALKISSQSPTTGAWLLNNPSFISWKSSGSGGKQVFTLYGIPGAGKTTLSSIIYNALDKEAKLFPGKFHLAHLALGFQYTQNNDCNTALKSLLYDQLAKHPDYAETLLGTLGGEYAQELSTTDSIQLLLESIFHFYGPMFLFVDGLDELASDTEIRKFLAILEAFLRNCPDIKVFISCRPEELIRKKIEKWRSTYITLSEGQNRKDIVLFTRHSDNLDILINTGNFDRESATRYLDAISVKADGMFLYAKLMIDSLDNIGLGLSVEALIDELPDGLDQAYERSLLRIASLNKNLRKRAKRVFKLLIGGFRPLRVVEVTQAALIEPGLIAFGQESRCSLGLLCGSLIETMHDDTVSLVHASLKQYLLQRDTVLNLRQIPIHRTISRLCWDYLGMRAVNVTEDKEYKKLLIGGEYVFIPYACQYLILHLQNSVQGLSEGLATKDKSTKSYLSTLKSIQVFIISLENKLLLDYSPIPQFQPREADIEAGTTTSDSLSETKWIDDDLKNLQWSLQTTMRRLNDALQNYATECDSRQRQSITRLYGMPFRCSDPKCVNFYVGFNDRVKQIEHIASHTRMFKCAINTCPYHHIGFGSAPDLNRHKNSAHSKNLYRDSQKESSSDQDKNQPISNLIPPQSFSNLEAMAKDALQARDMATAYVFLEALTNQSSKGPWKRFLPLFRISQVDIKNLSQHNKIDFFEPFSLVDLIFYYGDKKCVSITWALMRRIQIKAEGDRRIDILGCLGVAAMGRNKLAMAFVLDIMRENHRAIEPSEICFPLEWPELSQDTSTIILNVFLYLENIDQVDPTYGMHISLGFLIVWNGMLGDIAAQEFWESYFGHGWLRKTFRMKAVHGAATFNLHEVSISRLICLAIFIGHEQLISTIYDNGLVFPDRFLKMILARMVSCQATQEGIRNICELLKRKGAAFWTVDISRIIDTALTLYILSLKEHIWSSTYFLNSLRYCLELGVAPTDIQQIYTSLESFWDSDLMKSITGFRWTLPNDIVSLEILELINPILQMGVCPLSGGHVDFRETADIKLCEHSLLIWQDPSSGRFNFPGYSSIRNPPSYGNPLYAISPNNKNIKSLVCDDAALFFDSTRDARLSAWAKHREIIVQSISLDPRFFRLKDSMHTTSWEAIEVDIKASLRRFKNFPDFMEYLRLKDLIV